MWPLQAGVGGRSASTLLSLDPPRSEDPSKATSLVPLRDFADLDDASRSNATTQKALVNFSYHLSVGNLDEAFRAIKLIKR